MENIEGEGRKEGLYVFYIFHCLLLFLSLQEDSEQTPFPLSNPLRLWLSLSVRKKKKKEIEFSSRP